MSVLAAPDEGNLRRRGKNERKRLQQTLKSLGLKRRPVAYPGMLAALPNRSVILRGEGPHG
jgi:hypothetical protein